MVIKWSGKDSLATEESKIPLSTLCLLLSILKVREGRLRPGLLWSHLKVHISLNIYATLIYDIPKNRGLSHLFTDVRHINRHILILERTGHQFLFFLNFNYNF